MKIREIAELLDAEVICGEKYLSREVEFAFSSDLMSDVLTTRKDSMLLITGLATVQAVRTAEMSDIHCVIVARDKNISQEMIEIAADNEMVLMKCKYSVFRTGGLLYVAGIQPVY